MKKIILIMAVVVMAMVSSPVFGDDFEDWYSGRTKWDGTPRYHHSHNSNRGYGHRRGGHGGVAAIKSLSNKDGDQRYMVVYGNGRIAIVCGNGKIMDESNPAISRQALGLAGVLGALGILVGAH